MGYGGFTRAAARPSASAAGGAAALARATGRRHHAGGGESNGEGLRGSPMHAARQGALGDIMTRKRPATPSSGQEQCSPIPRSVIESSERPAVPARRDRREAIQEIPGEMRRVLKALGYVALVLSLLVHFAALGAWASSYHGAWIMTFNSGSTGWQVVAQLGGIRFMQYEGIAPTTQMTQRNGVLIPTINDVWNQPFIRYSRWKSYVPGSIDFARREPMWIWHRQTSWGLTVTTVRSPLWLFVLPTGMPVVAWLGFFLRRRAQRRRAEQAS
jgi:hypothetical protein